MLEIDFSPTVPGPYSLEEELKLEFSRSRAIGLTSYPYLRLMSGDRQMNLDVSYEPELVKASIAVTFRQWGHLR
jgi:hypothetical protein